jgi:hypothetical protein
MPDSAPAGDHPSTFGRDRRVLAIFDRTHVAQKREILTISALDWGEETALVARWNTPRTHSAIKLLITKGYVAANLSSLRVNNTPDLRFSTSVRGAYQRTGKHDGGSKPAEFVLVER